MFFFLWKKKKKKKRHAIQCSCAAQLPTVDVSRPCSGCGLWTICFWPLLIGLLLAGRGCVCVPVSVSVCVRACKCVCGSARACERLTWCTAERLLGLCCASIYLRSLFQTSNSGEKLWPWEELSSLTNTNAPHDMHTHTKTHPLFNCTQDDTKSLTLAVVIMRGWFHFVSVQRKALRR